MTLKRGCRDRDSKMCIRDSMKRDDALKLVKSYVKNENSRKHMIAVEAVMRSLAEKFGEDKNRWGLVGLLHDIDMELVDYGTAVSYTHLDVYKRQLINRSRLYVRNPSSSHIGFCSYR